MLHRLLGQEEISCAKLQFATEKLDPFWSTVPSILVHISLSETNYNSQKKLNIPEMTYVFFFLFIYLSAITDGTHYHPLPQLGNGSSVHFVLFLRCSGCIYPDCYEWILKTLCRCAPLYHLLVSRDLLGKMVMVPCYLHIYSLFLSTLHYLHPA